MNCKQGELAYLTKGPFYGVIFRCMERFDGPWAGGEDIKGWRLDRAFLKTTGRWEDSVADEYLRPIRDPGDKATDETLQWLDVPTKETA